MKTILFKTLATMVFLAALTNEVLAQLVVEGCTDVDACNFSSYAEVDDGSCCYATCVNFQTYNLYGGLAGAGEYKIRQSGVIILEGLHDGASTVCLFDGCYELELLSINYTLNTGFEYFVEIGGFEIAYGIVYDPGCCALAEFWVGVSVGCQDFESCNYAANAECDDGSCTYPGCNDSDACNYDPTAGCSDGSCTYGGCTDVEACNYDPSAICDDNTCHFLFGCTEPLACNYDSEAICNDGSCVLIYGCTIPGACNYNPDAIPNNGTCQFIFGCTNPAACNYDPQAGSDDGSCLLMYGCIFPLACNYNPDALCDDGFCIFGAGCNDPEACNYEPGLQCDDGSCHYLFGCTNAVACNYNNLAVCDDGTCILPDGCTDHTKCNYNPTSLCDDGTCVDGFIWYLDYDGDGYGTLDNTVFACAQPPGYVDKIEDCDDFNPAAYPQAPETYCNETDENCDGIVIVEGFPGCMDAAACNYVDAATCDNGLCAYASTWYHDGDLDGFGDANGTPIITCIPPMDYVQLGGDCDDTNFDVNPAYNEYCNGFDDNCNDAVDEGPDSGCTHPAATNYDPTKICDDGSCILPGCTYPAAINFNPIANADDGSCVFPNFDSCHADLDNNGTINTGDLLLFMSLFGTVCP